MFLTGINVHRPMWLILDIYGNSVGVEIIGEWRVPELADFRELFFLKQQFKFESEH